MTIVWGLVGLAFTGLVVFVFGNYLIKSARKSAVPRIKRKERFRQVLGASMAGAMFCCFPAALILVIIGRSAGIATILLGALIAAIHAAVFTIE